MKQTERVTFQWYDDNALLIEGSFLDKIIEHLYEQIRTTAKATHEEYINDTKWELTYDAETMEITIRRIFPS